MFEWIKLHAQMWGLEQSLFQAQMRNEAYSKLIEDLQENNNELLEETRRQRRVIQKYAENLARLRITGGE
jgi:septal ring factor EnvC (AmiA/AmiB activator)